MKSMKKLRQEFDRLYSLDDSQGSEDQTAGALRLVGSDDRVRAIIISFQRATDWARLAMCYQGLLDDLELSPPAISVSGRAGYQLWLSLAAPISLAQAQAFYEALRLAYLADIPVHHLRFYPSDSEMAVSLVPAVCEVTGKWSAFIDPTMGAMFVDEPGLEMAPNMDRQADILSGLKSIDAEFFERALGLLQRRVDAAIEAEKDLAREQNQFVARDAATGSRLGVGNNYTDPKSFLLAVMNDSSAGAGHRIKAAKALRPYFKSGK